MAGSVNSVGKDEVACWPSSRERRQATEIAPVARASMTGTRRHIITRGAGVYACKYALCSTIHL
jgi:hypothetical protein